MGLGFILKAVVSFGLAGSALADTDAIPSAQALKICREKKGILVIQESEKSHHEACFDPTRGNVNSGYTTMPNHGPIGEWQTRYDFDLLTNKDIHFYQHFREIDGLTVCNHSDKTLAIHFNSMDFLKTPTYEEVAIRPGSCKTNGTHMINIYPDIKTARKFFLAPGEKPKDPLEMKSPSRTKRRLPKTH
jgi:hypothetical protein